ncbi:MAG: TraR/DksA C4-type zinc finger protein [Patescibacteria group bacterium]
MQSFPNDVLTELQKHLEAEKKRVLARITQLTAQDPFSDPERLNDNAASDAEASEESSHDRFTAMIEELKAQLVDLENALARIAAGTYGFCVECKQMIDTDRLAILPTATLCLRCEQKKRSHNGHPHSF